VPTVIRTWTFTADAEGLTDVGDSAIIPSQWDSGAAALEFGVTLAGSGGSERARGPVTAGKDWTVLFPGIPANAIVTNVELLSMNWQRFGSASITAWQMLVRIVDSAGVSVTTPTSVLLDNTQSGTGIDASKVDISASSTGIQSVLAGKQAASTIVALEVNIIRTGGTTGNDIDADDIQIRVTYTLPVDAPHFGVSPNPVVQQNVYQPGMDFFTGFVPSPDVSPAANPVLINVLIAGLSTIAAALTVQRSLAVTPAGVSQVQSALQVIRNMAVHPSGTSTVVSDFRTPAVRIAAVIAGTSTILANLRASRTLSTVVAGTSSILPNLSLAGQKLLAAVVAGTSSVTAALRDGRTLTTTVVGHSTIVANLKETKAMRVVVSGSSFVTASLLGAAAGINAGLRRRRRKLKEGAMVQGDKKKRR